MSQMAISTTTKLLLEDLPVLPSGRLGVVASYPAHAVLCEDLETLVRMNDGRSCIKSAEGSLGHELLIEAGTYRFRRFQHRNSSRECDESSKTDKIIAAVQKVMSEMIQAAFVKISELEQFLAIITVEGQRASALRSHLANQVVKELGIPYEAQSGKIRLSGQLRPFASLSFSLCEWPKSPRDEEVSK